jgi:hypothetical protein
VRTRALTARNGGWLPNRIERMTDLAVRGRKSRPPAEWPVR